MYKYYIQIVVYLQLSFRLLLDIFEFPVWIDQVQDVEHDHDGNRLLWFSDYGFRVGFRVGVISDWSADDGIA